MSYEIIKSVTFYEKDKRIVVRSDSSNVTPKLYHKWEPVECGYGYEQWKRMFCGSCFGGETQFQPSCKSKAKKAYDNVNRNFGLRDTANGVWWEVRRMYPHEHLFNRETMEWYYDNPENKRLYDEFEERWTEAYVDELNRLIA